MQITLSEFVNFIEKNDRVNTRGFAERLNDKSMTGYNTSTYFGFVTITAKRDTLTEIFPVPGSSITRSIRSLIDNERGLERGADDEGFSGSGFIGFQLADRFLNCSRDSCFSHSLVHIELFETDHCEVLN